MEKDCELETIKELEYLQTVISDRENEKRNTNILQELCKHYLLDFHFIFIICFLQM